MKDSRTGGAPALEYKAVSLQYTKDAPSAHSGVILNRRGVDLELVNKLVQDGWRVHTFSFDEDGCWQEAIMVREGSR